MSIADVSPTTIRTRYPSIVDDWEDPETVRLIVTLIRDAEVDVDQARFSELRERAICALVAHKVVLRMREADGDLEGSMPISKAAAGPISTDFVQPPPDHVPAEYLHYYTTNPGVDYMELVARVVGRGVRLLG